MKVEPRLTRLSTVGRSPRHWLAAIGNTGDMRVRQLRVSLVAGAPGAWACAHPIPEPVAVHVTPHISWVISSTESPDGRERFVCRSDPRTSCVVRTSTPETKRLATVHVYLHPAAEDTKYTGTLQVGFFDAAPETYESKIDSTVSAGDGPRSVSVSDIVTQRPGEYGVTMSLAAKSAKQSQQIQDNFRVVVE